MSRDDRPHAEGPNHRAGLLTVVMQNANDGWRIIALHNTDRADQSDSKRGLTTG